jgi:CRP/FNR family putative post-exponential-phase nitrogen-starvation transcriptional regulator
VSQETVDHYIHAFELDQHLNPDLLRCLRLVSLPAQREFYVQTEEQTSIYLMVAGKVQVQHLHPNGKTAVLAMMTPLAVIGDLELFRFEDIKTNVVTLEPITLLAIEKPFVIRYGYDDPRFLRFIIHQLTSKLYESSNIHVGSVLSVTHRFAAYVLQLHEQGGDNSLLLPAKAHIASLLGTTSRHLNRVIRQLQDEGIVSLHGHRLTILNLQRLMEYAHF